MNPNFAAIDRKTGNVKLGNDRKDLKSSGDVTVVDLAHLDAQPPSTLASLYTQFTNRPARKATRLIMQELADAIVSAGGGVSGPVVEEGPVAICRRIFAQKLGRPRSEVIAACVEAGVLPSTARTQYQKLKSRQH